MPCSKNLGVNQYIAIGMSIRTAVGISKSKRAIGMIVEGRVVVSILFIPLTDFDTALIRSHDAHTVVYSKLVQHWVLPSSRYKKVLFDFYYRSR